MSESSEQRQESQADPAGQREARKEEQARGLCQNCGCLHQTQDEIRARLAALDTEAQALRDLLKT